MKDYVYVGLIGLAGAIVGAVAGFLGGLLKMIVEPYWLGMPMVLGGLVVLSPAGGACAGLLFGLLGGIGAIILKKRWLWISAIILAPIFGCLCGWLPFVYMAQ